MSRPNLGFGGSRRPQQSRPVMMMWSRRERPPVPTLAELRRSTCWVWIHCANRPACMHGAPAALAPFLIRWGEDASSDMLRRSARCTYCGAKGATLMLPSWQDSTVGAAPFPIKRFAG